MARWSFLPRFGFSKQPRLLMVGPASGFAPLHGHLRGRGLRVHAVPDAADLARTLRSVSPDGVVLEVGAVGTAELRRIIGLLRGARFVIGVSDEADPELVVSALAAGCDAYFSRTGEDFPALVSAIDELRSLSPEVRQSERLAPGPVLPPADGGPGRAA